MEFKKYPSLNNHYRQKEIGYWLDNYPELKDERYIIQEKIHGGNMSLWITKEEVKFAKRTSFLKEDESFYDYQNTMKKYEDEIKILKQYVEIADVEYIVIYGELFGKGVQKGIDYGEEKQFRAFDMYVEDELCSPLDMISIFEQLNIDNILVPEIAIVKGIFNVLEFDTKFNSKILNKENNICEGIVAKPLNNIYESSQGSVFYIKKKNDEFKEKLKSDKESKPITDNLLKLQLEFVSYINENRLNCVFSKEGEIQSDREIGKFIKLLMEDAKEDFIKDFGDDVAELDKNDLKMVYGKGNKNCANLVKKYL